VNQTLLRPFSPVATLPREMLSKPKVYFTG